MVPIPMFINYGENHCLNIIELTKPNILITDTNGINSNLFKYNLNKKIFIGNKPQIKNEYNLKDVAAIMCTSGTTGTPKGAMITQFGLKENVIRISKYFNINSSDLIMIARPLYHCAVLTGEFLVSLYKGVNIGFFDENYNPSSVLNFAIKNNITILCGTPTLFNHLSFFLKRNNLKHNIKKITLSGECLNEKTAKIIRKAFPYAEIYSVYGLTEAAPRVSYLSPQQFDEYSESVGLPLSEIEVKIIDEKNIELPINIHGQIIVKTPCIMKGYYDNEKATAKAIVNGWLNTGDIGYKDKNGYLYILSRSDDMIIKSGMNIYPKEIENQLVDLEQIKECVVYGTKTDVGQAIAIDIVLEDSNISKKEIMALFSNVLPTYQIPKKINIVESLRRNASGKILRIR